jgi:putative component of membrane protein insertase Oxa1/YidC/SpoIIIJ protein YidD
MRFRELALPAALFVLLLLASAHLSALAVWAIGGYRAHIAPALGIHCGYAHATGAESCSAYAARMLSERGMLRGLPLAMERFRACGALQHVNEGKRK